jgi:hypothetical protein
MQFVCEDNAKWSSKTVRLATGTVGSRKRRPPGAVPAWTRRNILERSQKPAAGTKGPVKGVEGARRIKNLEVTIVDCEKADQMSKIEFSDKPELFTQT